MHLYPAKGERHTPLLVHQSWSGIPFEPESFATRLQAGASAAELVRIE